MFLSSEEQGSCLAELGSLGGNAMACGGLDRLTSNNGGCSDLVVDDVNDRFADQLKSLSRHCRLESGSDTEWDRSCGECARSWRGIRLVRPVTDEEMTSMTKNSADDCVCSFATLVVLMSRRADDADYVQKLYKCLGEIKTDDRESVDENGSPKEEERGWSSKAAEDKWIPIAAIFVVALLGYCTRQDECFLVYELCPNGNISQWIFGKGKMLSWTQRLQIAVDTARGLRFLHTYREGCIVHRDIKPTNILLGQNFEAKLSDFGLSKVIGVGETNASSEVRGTFGYVDPVYQSNRQVNSSGDVYSFGVVLLQILSGKRVINMNTKRPVLLDKRAKPLTRGGSLTEFADPKLKGEYSAEAFILTFQLALSCTGLKHERPSVEQVVLKLEQALDISAGEPEPTPSRLSTP